MGPWLLVGSHRYAKSVGQPLRLLPQQNDWMTDKARTGVFKLTRFNTPCPCRKTTHRTSRPESSQAAEWQQGVVLLREIHGLQELLCLLKQVLKEYASRVFVKARHLFVPLPKDRQAVRSQTVLDADQNLIPQSNAEENGILDVSDVAFLSQLDSVHHEALHNLL